MSDLSADRLLDSLEDKAVEAYYQDMIERGYRYIVSLDRVRSGRPIVDGTRIGVHDVVGLYLLWVAEQMAEDQEAE